MAVDQIMPTKITDFKLDKELTAMTTDQINKWINYLENTKLEYSKTNLISDMKRFKEMVSKCN